ncbi:MAG: hypothetical protein M3211_05730 [Actinomycetota bacterium]|nr:hypothetical protein [Actinomycetota bacterium]
MLRPVALTGAALMLVVAAGCSGGGDATTEAGGGDTQAYCSQLKDAQQEFGALESGDMTGANLDKIFDRMHTLSEQAPPAVDQEWQTLDDAISQMESGLAELGLEFGDLTNPKKLQGVDPQKLEKFGQEMQKIGGQKFQRAGDAIEKHAKTECGIKLGQPQ